MKDFKEIRFPKSFLWGGATSSHQVEGGCVNNDWFLFEQFPGKILDGSVSGDACDHYNRYKDDFKLLKSLNHNAHRFSIEWSRVEPAKDYFSKVELDHYKDVVKSIKENGMEPMVTLHHFSTPVWLGREGSWANPDVIKRFEKYTQVVAEAIGKDVKFWFPINETVNVRPEPVQECTNRTVKRNKQPQGNPFEVPFPCQSDQHNTVGHDYDATKLRSPIFVGRTPRITSANLLVPSSEVHSPSSLLSVDASDHHL